MKTSWEEVIVVKKRVILCLDRGGPLDIPAVDKGKDCDAEDGQQLDGLVGRAALREEGLEGVDGEGEGNDGNGCRHDDDTLHPHPGKRLGSKKRIWQHSHLMNAGNRPRATMM